MANNVRVKLCGFSEPLSLLAAIENGADFIGFVFHEKSPRHVSPQQACELAKAIPTEIAKVAVVVDADLELLKNIASSLQPQYFQLHGSESKSRILEIKNTFPTIKIIKAFHLRNKKDLEQSLDFIDLADIFLFDSLSAGSGETFDWDILKDFSGKKEYFLSGGLNSKNVLEALKITDAKLVDVSSGIEKERGKKSPELIGEFMKKIKNVT